MLFNKKKVPNLHFCRVFLYHFAPYFFIIMLYLYSPIGDRRALATRMLYFSSNTFVFLTKLCMFPSSSLCISIHLLRLQGSCHAPPFTTDCLASASPNNHCAHLVLCLILWFCVLPICVLCVTRAILYCLGVLLEGLRIRLTSHYGGEAAGWGSISLYTTAC